MELGAISNNPPPEINPPPQLVHRIEQMVRPEKFCAPHIRQVLAVGSGADNPIGNDYSCVATCGDALFGYLCCRCVNLFPLQSGIIMPNVQTRAADFIDNRQLVMIHLIIIE